MEKGQKKRLERGGSKVWGLVEMRLLSSLYVSPHTWKVLCNFLSDLEDVKPAACVEWNTVNP